MSEMMPPKRTKGVLNDKKGRLECALSAVSNVVSPVFWNGDASGHQNDSRISWPVPAVDRSLPIPSSSLLTIRGAD